MTDKSISKTPNDVLAEIITKQLIKAKLIPKNRMVEFKSKLKNGDISQEDWSLWVDVATDPQKNDAKNNE